MSSTDPITAVWTGEAFVPDGNWSRAVCLDTLGAGEVTRLLINPDGKPRTERSHKHQFAWVRDALENLPEHMMDAPFFVEIIDQEIRDTCRGTRILDA